MSKLFVSSLIEMTICSLSVAGLSGTRPLDKRQNSFAYHYTLNHKLKTLLVSYIYFLDMINSIF